MRAAGVVTLSALMFVLPEPAAGGGPAPRGEWVPGEVVVAYRRTPVGADLDRLARRLTGAQEWRSLRHAPAAVGTLRQEHPLARVRIVKLRPDADVQEAARRISRIPGVAYAHPNYYVEPSFLPDDLFFQNGTQYGPQIIRAPEAWDTTRGDSSVVIAVADTGILYFHEDLAGAIWTNDGEFDPPDGVDNDGNGFVDDWRGWNFMRDTHAVTNANGHGTHVAGIAAGVQNNGRGIAGVCQARIMVLQVFDRNPESGVLEGTWEATANAIYYAVDNGARVLNYSASGRDTGTALNVVRDAVQYAWQHDMTIVAAMGNFPRDPPHAPAVYPETIAVGATTSADTLWQVNAFSGSGLGPHVDVAAPGEGVFSTWDTGSTRYAFSSGTSMATPHVTGLVGLMLSVNPNLHVEDIRRLLHENATDLGASGFDDFYGWGRIDAKATLDAVIADTVPPEIVHNEGVSTRPHSGYIDPRLCSSDGESMDLGIDSVFITFTKPVRDAGSGEGGALTAAAFSIVGISSIGGDGPSYPQIVGIEDGANPTVEVLLGGPIPPGQWTTIVADVEDLAGNRIVSVGDLGPGLDEPDRVDIGFLPGDVDGDGRTVPQDLIRFRGIMSDTYHNPVGEDADYADTNRDGLVSPEDLIQFRRLISGVSPATRSWSGAALPARP